MRDPTPEKSVNNQFNLYNSASPQRSQARGNSYDNHPLKRAAKSNERACKRDTEEIVYLNLKEEFMRHKSAMNKLTYLRSLKFEWDVGFYKQFGLETI